MFNKISDYIFTPKDIYRGIRYDIIPHLKRRDKWGIIFFIMTYTALQLLSPFHTESILFMLFIISYFYWKWDPRFAILLGLICLAFIPALIFIFQDNITVEDFTERLAVWAFYFLSIGVLIQIYEFIKENKKNDAA